MTLWFDVFLILVIFVGMMIGFNMGLVRQLLSALGLYFGLIFASYAQPGLSRMATQFLGETSGLLREAVIFFLVFTIVWLLITVGMHFSFRTPPRFLPPALDRVVGALVGGVTGILVAAVLTLLLTYATSVTWPQNNNVRQALDNSIENSFLEPLFMSVIPVVANTIDPWLPRGLPAFFAVR